MKRPHLVALIAVAAVHVVTSDVGAHPQLRHPNADMPDGVTADDLWQSALRSEVTMMVVNVVSLTRARVSAHDVRLREYREYALRLPFLVIF